MLIRARRCGQCLRLVVSERISDVAFEDSFEPRSSLFSHGSGPAGDEFTLSTSAGTPVVLDTGGTRPSLLD